MTLVSPALLEEMDSVPRFNASSCMNCGICTAVCPMEIEHLPRQLFRYVMLGLEDDLRKHEEAVFSCLLCGMCEENCPAGVHIVENVRALRHYFNRKVFRL
jgi:heterodisulfide reductase subunit C